VTHLIDSTLREGTQSPRAHLSLERKVRLAAGLAEVGCAEIEVGPAVPDDLPGGESVPHLVAAIRARAPALRIGIWCRGLPGDVEAACAAGCDVVSICLPVSEVHLRARLRRPRSWVIEQAVALTALASGHGARRVCLGLEDATRADPAFLDEVVDTAREAGAARIRLADTVGVATPSSVASLVRRCAGRFPGEVGVHTHNDFGMATANAVAAVEAGAAWADTSVLGLGERAGIARTEELAAFLRLRWQEAYRVELLRALCHDVARWTGHPVPPRSPVVGEEIFTCGSGLHLDGLDKDPRTYEPYPPALLGRRARSVLGAGAGRRAVARFLRDHGLFPDHGQLTEITGLVRRAATARGRILTDAEILSLARGEGGCRALPLPAPGPW
jgi:homocitrate synthase NifV